MVWGAFSSKGKLQLAFPSTRMDSAEYQSVLRCNLLPFIRRFRKSPMTFQQDNASVHVSNSTKAWFTTNKIKVLQWPACSPDCNPMENLWGILTRKVYSENKQYSSIQELKKSILSAWEGIEVETLEDLVKSMENRIFIVINKNGGYTGY